MNTGFKTREIGRTGLQVSVLGFGAASLGNLYKAVTDEDAKNTVIAGIESGMRLFDTAPRYGLGLSERRVGDVLRTLPKSDYMISTKVGRLLSPDPEANVEDLRYGFATPMPFDAHYDYTYDGIMRSYEDSMQRLGLTDIDILLIHDIGSDTHGNKDAYYYNQLVSSGYKAVDELRLNGHIKAVGLGVNETEICERLMEVGQFDCFLLAGRYSLLEQGALDSFFPKCLEHGASVILGGPYNSGVLATGVKGNSVPKYNYEPAPQHILDRVGLIEGICERYDVTLAAAALQFPLGHTAVASVIPGLGSVHRVKQTVKLFQEIIPTGFWEDLKAQGLLSANAPVPE